jgi:NADP-dependent 3-hydroxy acid dehydrogenase YdfG
MTPQRTAVVVGASSGIGRATASLLNDQGMNVVAIGRRRERLETLRRDDGRRPEGVAILAADATRPGMIELAVDQARASWNTAPDAFVLCAGRGLPGTILASDDSRWPELLELNYLAMLTQLRSCGRSLVKAATSGPRQRRDIVVIGSTVGRHVSPHNPVYGSTKFAVHSLVDALRQEVCEHAVRVSLVEPGFVRSEFQSTAGYDPVWFETVEERYGPLLTPADVASTILFILQQPPHVHVDNIRLRPTRQPN